MRRISTLALGLLLALGCAQPGPGSPVEPLLAEPPARGPAPVELTERLGPGAWEREGDAWWATSTLARRGAVLAPGAAPRWRRPGDAEEDDPGAERVAQRDGERVAWRGEGPPDLVLVWPTSTGRAVPGPAGGRRWRVEVGGLASDGLALPAGGAPVRVPAARPAGTELRAAVSCVALEPLRLEVRAGGRPLAELTFAPEGPGRGTLSVRLPDDLPEETRLDLAAVGGEGILFLHAPRLVRTSAPPARRPDLLVLLADTFRADNLGAYGAEGDWTPALDALAEEAVVFERAWAPSAWTLPSHASLFTGIYPHEHGAVAFDRRPNERLGTLAGRLREAGYRTCAITDGHFVSRRFGLDAGFEWFEEMSTIELYKTLLAALARLDDDDGRPLFLFVHTYRVHGPYAPSEQALERHGDELGLAEAAALQERVYRELIERQEAGGPPAEALRELMAAGDWHAVLASTAAARAEPGERGAAEALHRLYLGGVTDLDREVGLFLDELDRRGFHEEGVLVFTSDHGEAFDEHGLLFHARGTWDEVLRIPLLVRGPGLAPARVAAPATLVDLPRTLAGRAGVAPDPRWRGRDLFASEPGAVFAYDCAQGGDAGGALVEGTWKLSFAADEAGRRGETRGLYDLERDPGERHDLAEREAARVEELLRRLGPLLRELSVEAFAPGTARLDASERRRLEAMGYVDD